MVDVKVDVIGGRWLVDLMVVDWLVVGRYDSLVHVIGGRWSVDVMDELVDIIRWLV